MDKWRILYSTVKQLQECTVHAHDEVLEHHYHTWATELKGMAKAFTEVLGLMDQLEDKEETLARRNSLPFIPLTPEEFSGPGIGEWDDLSTW